MKIGLGSLLFVVFLTLKLTHNIDWSWWLVTGPLWMPLAVVLGATMLFAVVIGTLAIIDEILK